MKLSMRRDSPWLALILLTAISTVGFIDRLPHALVAAFRATLEEVAEADLILHVIDASSVDRDRRRARLRTAARPRAAHDGARRAAVRP